MNSNEEKARRALQLVRDDLQKGLAHHIARVQWLSQPNPTYVDGILVEKWLQRSLLESSRNWISSPGYKTGCCHCEPPCVLPEEA